jgi:hypothetical protein
LASPTSHPINAVVEEALRHRALVAVTAGLRAAWRPAAPGLAAGELVLAGGASAFHISAPTTPDLVDRLAFVLGEHMRDGRCARHLQRAPEDGWTELHFESSPFVVLHGRDLPS